MQINACICAGGNGALGVANYVDENKDKVKEYATDSGIEYSFA